MVVATAAAAAAAARTYETQVPSSHLSPPTTSMPSSTANMPALEHNNNNNLAGSTGAQRESGGAQRKSQLDYKRSSSQGSELSSLSSQNSDEQANLRLSNADYDHIRNTTLMFFLDRLFLASKEGKEARTLHDLSCLFGTKDFTKEMRQIVGASRNGLKKFLQAYPSLFTIEGDKVYLTQLEQEASQSARDYNKEAVEYFRQKLLQFGTSLVPIKNLFGYRSQASQEVRHVSGKNAKEFRQFLSQNEHVFELVLDDHVVLKSALAESEAKYGEGAKFASLQPMSLASQLSQPDDNQVIDPYLNKQFAHIVESCLKDTLQSQGHMVDEARDESAARVPIGYLHEKIVNECNNQLFLKMVKTTDEFRVFLRTHPKIFKRIKCDRDQKEYVSLLTDQERRELDAQTYPSSTSQQHQQVLTRQHSTLKQDIIQVSQSSDKQQPSSLSASSVQLQQNPLAKADAKPAGLTDQAIESSNNSHKPTGNNSQPVKRDNQDELEASEQSQNRVPQPPTSGSALRATAPPFVPSSGGRQHLGSTQSHLAAAPTRLADSAAGVTVFPPSQQQATPPLLQRSKSNLNSGSPVIDPRQSLRSYLIKANANNSAAGIYSPSKQSNGALYQSQAGSKALVRQTSALNNDDLRARTVDIVREASNIITRIMTTTDAVAFDCKGFNLDFNGQITLIQFAFLPGESRSTGVVSQHDLIRSSSLDKQQVPNADGGENRASKSEAKRKPEVCIFDLITNPELAYCLKPLLESEQIVKIVHDVRSKSCALHSQFGIMLNRVFDTQVANLVIQQQETGKPAYKSRYISMSKLCEVYGDEDLIKYRNLIKSKTRHNNSGQSASGGKIKDVNYWRQRPLTESMVYESTMDVYCLIGGVYQNLKSQIQVEYMPLFDQLNLEGVLARIKPDEIRSVKKERKIDLEVIDLKRKLYAETTCSIVLSNREVRLLRHIDLTEEVRNKIQQCKKVAKKLERLDMKAAQNAQSTGAVGDHTSDTDVNPSEPNNLSSLVTNDSESSSQQGSTTTDDKAAEVLDENGLPNLMDSSMFDELKVKMIESSSLLESLEDDDDGLNVEVGQSLHDSCRCSCHHRSPISSGEFNTATEKDASPSLKSSKSDRDDTSIESRGVDIAVQCDLLN